MDRLPWSARTRLIAQGRPDSPGAPLNTPIVGASAFIAGAQRGYARAQGTPTWEAAETIVGDLEGGTAVLFGSGMAAIAAVLDGLPLQGRVAAPTDCYLGTSALLDEGAGAGRWSVTRLQATDTAAWQAAAATHDLLWLESPTNPLLQVMDLPRILTAARSAGCRTAVDATFATPLGLQPLQLGADLVVHSATKYLGGHSDLLAGVAVAASPQDAEVLVQRRTLLGATPGMLEAFLLVRGLRTLGLRFDAASSNAALLAARLREHPSVGAVRYPGLADDPGHALAQSFMTGFGAMVSFDMLGGAPAAELVLERLRLVRHATSLGGVESTIERRGALQGQEHVPDGLLRLSTGCEDPEDLWRDLSGARDASLAGPVPSGSVG
jgi:cystathionine gamma-synthase